MVHSIATDIVMTNVLAAGWKGNHCLCPVGVLEVWWRHSKAWAGAGSIDWALVSVRTLHNQHQPSHHQVGPHSLCLLLTNGPGGLKSQTVAAIIRAVYQCSPQAFVFFVLTISQKSILFPFHRIAIALLHCCTACVLSMYCCYFIGSPVWLLSSVLTQTSITATAPPRNRLLPF